MRFYKRVYNLSILTWRGETIDVSELRFTFRIEKNVNKYMQIATFDIYNLAATTETDLFKNAKEVSISVGYEGSTTGQIFKGKVRQSLRGKDDGTTYYLRLVCLAGDDAINIGFCSLVLQGNQTARDIAEQIARSSKPAFDLTIKGELSPHLTQAPKVVFGKSIDALRGVARNNNAVIYADEDGGLTMSTLSQGPPANVPLLNSATGLIGFPQQTDEGVQFRTLINPEMKLDTWVKLNNADILQEEIQLGQLQNLLDVDGLYRIIRLVATGDTRGNDWYFDIDAITQTGGLPDMLRGLDQLAV